MFENMKQAALDYHEFPKPGKIATELTKPTETQKDLCLAYTPGVAEPVKAIAMDPDAAYRYTSKGNLVAVISDGTAVLGLGNVGALAGKPVMEGKGVLFKRFADVDVFDIEVTSSSSEDFINTKLEEGKVTTKLCQLIDCCLLLAPSSPYINLGDIRSTKYDYLYNELKALGVEHVEGSEVRLQVRNKNRSNRNRERTISMFRFFAKSFQQ